MSWFIRGSEAYFTRLRFKTPAQEARLIRIARQNVTTHYPSYVIREALRRHKEKVAVLWSGGRCSTVLVHMALKISPEMRVLFVNTGVEYQETVRYVEKLGKIWHVNLEILRPERMFWDIVREYGPPTARRPSNMRKGERDTPPCCFWLKKKPVKEFARENGIEALLTGMRAGESTVRAIVLRQKGAQFYFVKDERVWKYHPLAFWNTKRVSEYILKNDIPLNPLYLKLDRVGCWPCSAYFGWRTELSEANSKYYQVVDTMFHGVFVSPCSEGKAMHHLLFEDARLGRNVAELLSGLRTEVEVHDEGRVVCVSSGLPKTLLDRVLAEAELLGGKIGHSGTQENLEQAGLDTRK